MLIIFQVALAVILLGAAGLLIRDSRRIGEANRGYRPDSILTMIINLPETRYKTHPQMLDFFDQVTARLKALPGVQDVGATTTLPFGAIHSTHVFSIEGRPWQSASEAQNAEIESASANYLHVMGIPLIRGREFTEQDSATAPDVVMISQSLARAYWPNVDPVGHRLKPYAQDDTKHSWMTIVGVVADVTLDWTNRGQGFIIYRPQRQFPRIYSAIAIRASGNPDALVPAVRTANATVDADQTPMEIKSMHQVIRESTITIAYDAMMMSALGGLAMVLAAVGVYGVMAFIVADSTHEIGIRMALGAVPSDVLRLIVGRGMLLTGAGIVIGVPISCLIAPLLAVYVPGIEKSDPLILSAVSIALSVAALAACWIPARRATRVDPLEALRYE